MMKSLLALITTCVLMLSQSFTVHADDQSKGKGKPGARPGDPQAAFKKLDTNRDNKVSKEEFFKSRNNVPQKFKSKGNGQWGDRLFDLADGNKDGFLSLVEFKKMRERITSRMKSTQGPGKGKFNKRR